jgi:hypothetical protein
MGLRMLFDECVVAVNNGHKVRSGHGEAQTRNDPPISRKIDSANQIPARENVSLAPTHLDFLLPERLLV